MKIGDKIDGRYEIVSFIGEGSSAFTFKGYDTINKKDVAIKVMKEEMKETMAHYEGFFKEASFLASLRHLNIVSIYCFSFFEGRPCIMCELMKVDNLSNVLMEHGPYPFLEAKAIILQVLEAIEYTHEKGYIHRDIKPQNIFYGKDGVVKLSDFGIAIYTGMETNHHRIYGSISYLAPEVIQGKSASKQSDLYAIGITLYELLMGKLPFEGESIEEIARKQIEMPFPSVGRGKNRVELDRFFQKACAKNPLDRYKNAAEMKKDLLKITLDKPKRKSLFSFFFRRKNS